MTGALEADIISAADMPTASDTANIPNAPSTPDAVSPVVMPGASGHSGMHTPANIVEPAQTSIISKYLTDLDVGHLNRRISRVDRDLVVCRGFKDIQRIELLENYTFPYTNERRCSLSYFYRKYDEEFYLRKLLVNSKLKDRIYCIACMFFFFKNKLNILGNWV